MSESTRYVVLNPVHAGVVAAAEDWPWSSYRATAGIVSAPSWLHVDGVLANFAAERDAARAADRQFVALGMDAESPWRSLHGQIRLGGDQFRQRMARMVAQQALAAVPSTQAQPERPSVAELLASIAEAFGLASADLFDRSDQAAFNTTVYLLRRICNLPRAETARLAGISISRVSRIQTQVEQGQASGLMQQLLDKYGALER